jgi:hypothetical protein
MTEDFVWVKKFQDRETEQDRSPFGRHIVRIWAGLLTIPVQNHKQSQQLIFRHITYDPSVKDGRDDVTGDDGMTVQQLQ